MTGPRIVFSVLLTLAIIVWLCSWSDYYPIGYFGARWYYLFVLLVGMTLVSDGIAHMLSQLWVQIIMGIAVVVGFIPLMFLTANLFMSMGIEHETLAENDRYRLAQLMGIPRSGGQSEYALFEKMPLGERCLYKSHGYILEPPPRLLERDSLVGIIKNSEDSRRRLDTLWIRK